MKHSDIISQLLDRKNDLSIKRTQVNLSAGSLGNPSITVGTQPYYDWDKDKRITYIITYGRYLSLEMLVYEKLLKDIAPDYLKTKDRDQAEKYIQDIINRITATR
jgi:hypothetical protein